MDGGGITLSAGVRQTLVSLQQTSVTVNRAQNRLSTGLRVAHAEDDPAVYFSARALGDRASDLLAVKDGISSGISTVTTAITALKSMEDLIAQMRGVALSAKFSEAPERQKLADKFNELRDNLDSLSNDATYQGLNLIGSSPGTLNVRLNENSAPSASSLKIVGKTITAQSLGIDEIARSVTINESNYNNGNDEQDAWIEWLGLARGGDPTAPERIIAAGGMGMQVFVGQWPGAPRVVHDGTNFNVSTINAANVSAFADSLDNYFAGGGMSWDANMDGVADTVYPKNTPGWDMQVIVAAGVDSWAASGYMDNIDKSLDQLDGALSTVRSTAAGFASNVATLQTRSDFTGQLVNWLQEGRSKLVNADLNEEGATVVTMQTRAQLSMQALSFAANSESSVMTLMRGARN